MALMAPAQLKVDGAGLDAANGVYELTDQTIEGKPIWTKPGPTEEPPATGAPEPCGPPNSIFFEMSQWHLTNIWGLELYLCEDYEEDCDAPDPDWEWMVEDGRPPAPTVVPWAG